MPCIRGAALLERDSGVDLTDSGQPCDAGTPPGVSNNKTPHNKSENDIRECPGIYKNHYFFRHAICYDSKKITIALKLQS